MYIFLKLLYIINCCVFHNLSVIMANEGLKFRVRNGTVASPNSFPYQVAIKKQVGEWYRTTCGGAIIESSKVLTAAHCFDSVRNRAPRTTRKPKSLCCDEPPRKIPEPYKLGGIYVVGGSIKNFLKYSTKSKKAQWRRAGQVITDSRYIFPRHDVAVLLVTRPFVYNAFIDRIPYAMYYEDYGDRECIISGFGELGGRMQSQFLMWAYVDMINVKTCSEYFSRKMDEYVCTYVTYSNIGKGDSGGPLVCYKTGHKNEGYKGILVGVACGSAGRVAVFARASSYLHVVRALTGPRSSTSAIVQDTSWICAYFFIWILLGPLL